MPKAIRKKELQLFPDGFWSRPRIDPNRKGDLSSQAIYEAVGQALSQFEQVEETLSTLFLKLTLEDGVTAHGGSMAVIRAFGAIEANSARLAVIEAAAEVYFGSYWKIPEVREQFDQVIKNVRLAAYVRNEIAHGKCLSVTAHGKNELGETTVTVSGYFLVAPSYITGRTSYGKTIDRSDPLGFTMSDYRFTAADIISFGDKFGILWTKISNYMTSMNKQNGMPKNVFSLLFPGQEMPVIKSNDD